LRLHIRRLQAKAGDIVLLFVDESDFLNVPYLTRVWASQGRDLRVEAPGKVKRRSVSGARNSVSGRIVAHISRSKKTEDFLSLLGLIEKDYGPKQPEHRPEVVLVLDNGPSHTSHATRKALAARSAWLSVEWLPKFSPELNDIERDWRVLKGRYLGNRNFAHEIDLERSVVRAIDRLNTDRQTIAKIAKCSPIY
jgi:hypothetical protein